jgi:hypothetical protein
VKFKFNAGAEFDVLTQKELEHSLKAFGRDWMVELAKGPRTINFFGSGVISAAGTLSMGGESADPSTGRWGPDQGMVWAIKRWNVRGLTDTHDTLSAWNTVNTAGRSIIDGITGYNRFGSDELVLRGGESLMFTGTGLATAAATKIYVSGAAWELPVTLMYKLM